MKSKYPTNFWRPDMPPETQAEQDLYDLSLAQAWPAEQQLALGIAVILAGATANVAYPRPPPRSAPRPASHLPV